MVGWGVEEAEERSREDASKSQILEFISNTLQRIRS